MKHVRLIVGLVAAATMTYAADLPPDVADARKRFDAAVAVAIKPARDKYIQELNQLKNRAISLKNLELALAIDQEIKSVGGAPATSAVPGLAAGKDLTEVLPGTTWLPQKASDLKSVSFADGRIVTTDIHDVTGRMLYEIAKDGDTVTWQFSPGNPGSLKFNRDRQQFTYHGVIYKQGSKK